MNKETQSNLRLLIQRMLNMPAKSVRPRDFTQPNEGKSFAMVHVENMQNIGWSGSNVGDNQYAEARIVVDFFGDNADTYASQLHKAMQSDLASEGLEEMGIGYLYSGNIINLTGLELERLARFQTSFNVSFLINIDSEGIDTGEITEINIDLRAEP